MIPDHNFNDYRNRRVLVMGLGSFGGGTGAVKFLVQRGAHVTVTDLRPRERLQESLDELKQTPPDRLVLGGHSDEDFRSADLIVVNPAVKRDAPMLAAAIQAGVPTTSEMNLFWKWNPAPIVAVTGSNGKSTTTVMIHSILQRYLDRRMQLSSPDSSPRLCGEKWEEVSSSFDSFPTKTNAPCVSDSHPNHQVWLGGNIGTSLLPIVDQIQPQDIVVLELSSFQLADLDRIQVSPHVAVVTNFAPNHLDWHPNLDHYRQSKQTILRWQTPDDIAVLNADDPDVRQWPAEGKRLEFGATLSAAGAFTQGRDAVIRLNGREQHWPLGDWLKLPGQHNVANALAAMAAATSLGANIDDVRLGIENYQALPHRLQFVAEVAGRRFYNDSLATTPESTEVALAAFDAPIVLLAGGYDKHVDLSRMSSVIARSAKSVSLMGQTANQLHQLISSDAAKTCELSSPQPSFIAAFDWAVEHSDPGDVILLSPGCASYDWFRNFADRGIQFTELVRKYEATQ